MGGGVATSAHLQQAAKTLGISYEKLLEERNIEIPTCPEDVEYLWDVFNDLSGARGSNGWEANTLQFRDILSYRELTGIPLQGWEVGILRRLDEIYMEVWRARSRVTNASNKQRSGQ